MTEVNEESTIIKYENEQLAEGGSISISLFSHKGSEILISITVRRVTCMFHLTRDDLKKIGDMVNEILKEGTPGAP